MRLGIPVSNMYAEPNEESSVVSQALYGQSVQILNTHGQFSHIQTADEYYGWIHSSHLFPKKPKLKISAKTIHNISHVYTTPDVTKHKPLLSLPFGIELDVISEHDRWVEVQLVDNQTGWIQRGNLSFKQSPLSIPEMIQLSYQFIGLPYTWGGTSSFGFDCSGFIQMLFKEVGVTLPRDAHQQIHAPACTLIDSQTMLPGDLIFYGGKPDKIGHVSVSIGEGKMIHSSVLPVPLIAIYPLDEPTLLTRYPYSTVRRVSASLYENG